MEDAGKVIIIEDVQQDLKDGLTRDDIAVKYGITKTECKLLFQDPDLKGRKTIKKIVPSFTTARRGDTKKVEEIVVDEAEVVVNEEAEGVDTPVESDTKEASTMGVEAGTTEAEASMDVEAEAVAKEEAEVETKKSVWS